VSPTHHLRVETDPLSKTLCSLEYRMMDKVQKFNNPEENVCTTFFSKIVSEKEVLWVIMMYLS
jgi:hypothetical protein